MGNEEKQGLWRSCVERLRGFPASAIAAALGMGSLGSIWRNIGLEALFHLAFLVGTLFVLAMVVRTIYFPRSIRDDFANPALVGLFPTCFMIFMFLGTYLQNYIPGLGKAVWIFGIAGLLCEYIFYFYFYIRPGFQLKNTNPAHTVFLTGIILSGVLGGNMGEPGYGLLTAALGMAFNAIALPVMFYRMKKYPLPEEQKLTRFILLALPSLLGVDLITYVEQLNFWLITVVYLVAMAVYVYVFSGCRYLFGPFKQTYAAITFPSAISCFFTLRYSQYLTGLGHVAAGGWLYQLFGLQLAISTLCIGGVFFQYFRIFCQNVYAIIQEQKTRALK